jgi:hypothetical protein
MFKEKTNIFPYDRGQYREGYLPYGEYILFLRKIIPVRIKNKEFSKLSQRLKIVSSSIARVTPQIIFPI